MTLANKITIFRIFLVIPFILFLLLSLHDNGMKNVNYHGVNKNLIFFIIAAFLFIFAMITDFIDGKIARKYNKITTFGKIFDPLADKIITNSTLIIFSVYNIVPIWITLIIILRDIIVDGLRTFSVSKNIDVSASFWGKLKTMLLSFSIIFIFIILPFWNNNGLSSKTNYDKDSYLNWILLLPLILSMILSIISGYKYFIKINKHITYK